MVIVGTVTFDETCKFTKKFLATKWVVIKKPKVLE